MKSFFSKSIIVKKVIVKNCSKDRLIIYISSFLNDSNILDLM